MAKGYEVGTAYVAIMPQTKGLTKELSKAVSGSGLAGACTKEGKAGGDGFIGGITGALKGAAIVGAGVTAGKALVDGIKDAIDKYATFEQLQGGVEKIFDQADQAQIFEDAANAYKDLNMSANEYLESINSVGAAFASTMGDQAGYDTARKGMQAIADYASGTGRNLGELNEKYQLITRSTSSYQSIADQFSGILPATSSAFLEQAQAAGFLGDQYTSLTEVPIEEYQAAVTNMLEKGVTDMGLYGNTVAESTETISGSLAMTQSAWENFITDLGRGDADISQSVGNLIESVSAVAKNIGKEIPVIVSNALTALPILAQQATEWLFSTTSSAIAEYGPQVQAWFNDLPGNVGTWINSGISLIFDAGNSLIGEIVKGLNGGDEHATLETTITNLPETVKGWIVGAAETLQEKGREFIAGLLFGTTEVSEGELKTKIEGLPGEIVGFIGDVSETLLGIGQGLINGLLGGVNEIINGDLTTTLSTLPETLAGLVGDTFTTLGTKGREFIQGFWNGISEFTGSDLATNLATFAGTAAGFIGETISTLVQLGIDFITGFLTGAQEKQDGDGVNFFGGFLELVKGQITTGIDVLTFLGEIGTQLISGFLDGVSGGKWTELKNWLGKVPNVLKTKIGNLGKTLLQKGKDFIEGFKTGAQNIGSQVATWIKSIPSTLVTQIGSLGTKLLQKGKDFIGGFKTGAENIGSQVGTWINGLPGTLVSLLGNLVKTLLQSGKDLLQGMFDGIKDIFDSPDGVSNFFTNLGSTIVGLIPNPIDILTSVGEDVINGFLNGIQNISLKPILETIFGTDLANTICGVLGIESPSKVTKEFGKYTTQGFANGLKDSGAVNSVTNNAKSLRNTVTNGIGDTSSLLTEKGKGATKSFANGISDSAVRDGVKTKSNGLRSFVTSGVGDTSGLLTGKGRDATKSLAGGINDWYQKDQVGQAAKNVRQKVVDNMSQYDSWTWGNHMVANFAAGMEYARSQVEEKSYQVLNTINRLWGHTTPDEGPLKNDDEWGYHFAQNIVNGMLRGQPLIEQTARDLAGVVDSSMGGGYMFDAPSVNGALMTPRYVGVNVSGPFYVRDDSDIERIAERLSDYINAQIAGSLA